MKELILATNNQGKIAELQSLLSPVHCISQASLGIESVEETGLSFVENALLKARYASKITGKPALADDSGLVVSALGGAPGIYSARYAGDKASDADNIRHLLAQLNTVASSNRQAYYYCAMVLVQDETDPTPLIACGRWDGVITNEARGEQGFGYDPVFYLPSELCTVAQLSSTLKNRVSHRAKALQQLLQQLSEQS